MIQGETFKKIHWRLCLVNPCRQAAMGPHQGKGFVLCYSAFPHRIFPSREKSHSDMHLHLLLQLYFRVVRHFDIIQLNTVSYFHIQAVVMFIKDAHCAKNRLQRARIEGSFTWKVILHDKIASYFHQSVCVCEGAKILYDKNIK